MAKILWQGRDLELRSRGGTICRLPDFDIKSGEHVALLGSNRDFRRAMFRAMAGLEAPKVGRLSVDGEDLPTRDERHPWRDLLSKKLRRKIGVSLESEGLLSNVSVRESLETLFRFKYGDHNAGLVEGASRVVEETALKVGLEASALNKRPSDLGRLELRLASLCLAFLTKPIILLLENPSQGLHDRGWQALSETLEQILEGSQRTLVMDTDDWLLAKKHATRWIVFDGDQAIYDGSPEGYVSSGGTALLRELESERWRANQSWIEELRKNLGAA
jgi:ABC-type multidrug transport system ATPase subunit